jgi:hypothetical protein
MNRRKTIGLTAILLLTLSFVIGGIYITSAQTEEGEDPNLSFPRNIGGWRMRHFFFPQLDEDQAEALRDLIEEMKSEGAEHDEIKTAVEEYYEGIGLEFQRPELTDEQREGLEQLRAEIQELVKQRTEELGINFPVIGRGIGFGLRGIKKHKSLGCQ